MPRTGFLRQTTHPLSPSASDLFFGHRFSENARVSQLAFMQVGRHRSRPPTCIYAGWPAPFASASLHKCKLAGGTPANLHLCRLAGTFRVRQLAKMQLGRHLLATWFLIVGVFWYQVSLSPARLEVRVARAGAVGLALAGCGDGAAYLPQCRGCQNCVANLPR